MIDILQQRIAPSAELSAALENRGMRENTILFFTTDNGGIKRMKAHAPGGAAAKKWATIAEGKPSPHEDVLVNVEVFRGAIRKGQWKLVKHALLAGRTGLYDLSKEARSTRRRPGASSVTARRSSPCRVCR